MSLYFLHLVDGEDVLLDPDGIDATEDEIEKIALECARDCIANDAHSGQIKLTYRIDVQDAAGKVTHSVAFRDAVTSTE